MLIFVKKFMDNCTRDTDKLDICSSSNRSRSAATLFPINVARLVDVFNKIAERTSTPISC